MYSTPPYPTCNVSVLFCRTPENVSLSPLVFSHLTFLEAIFHICFELICHIWAGFICFQLGVNCFCLAVISEQERNQSSNEGNQMAVSLANLQASSSWIKWAMYIHKQHEEINIQDTVSSKGVFDEENGSVWKIRFN